MKTKGSLVRTIFISMISVAVVSILLLGILMVHYEYVNFNRDSKELRDEFMETQKTSVKNEVEKVVDYIGYMKSRQRDGMEANLKERTSQAYNIATNIYNENKGLKDIRDIEKMVKDALRPIRFYEGRGYYFAVRLDGVEQLFPDRPDMEGINLLNLLDTKGKYVIKDMIDIVKKDREGIYEYTWTKPEQEGKAFPKLSYIKLFEPFNWLIGTGEYIDDDNKSMQTQILDRIAEIRFGKEGYISVVTYDGVTLMNDTQRELIGKNVWELTDPNGVKVIQEERKAIENPEGGFIYYVCNKPTETKPAAKISFMKGIKDWEWMVGADIYVDEIDKIIGANRVILEQRVRYQLMKVSLLLLFLIAATFLMAKYISRRIDKSLVIFASFFQKAADESTKIELKEVNFSEFETLALSANRMIGQREEVERSLRENEEKYRILFNMESDALALVDQGAGNILDVNKSFVNLFGYSREEILSMKEGDFSAGPDYKDPQSNEDNEYIPGVNKKKKDGSHFPSEVRTSNFEYQGRNLQLLAVRDISDRKKLEAQLRQSQKMEAIGTLAGGIAHDFNNVLLPIMGHAEMLMMGLPPDSHVQYNLKQIYEAGNRAKEMIKQIMVFSRKDKQEKRPVSLGSVINDTVKLLRGSIPTTIDIKYDIKTDSDTVMANATQIHRIILNLCTNSAYSMREKGGLLQIELDEFILSDDKRTSFQSLIPGRYLRLTVKDTGTGIEKANIEKIFEPYFTTKKTGEGTGMGLAVVHGIVLDHKGDISVESEPGKGATFRILLPPYHGSEAVTHSGIDRSRELQKGNEKVLLVDDEKIVADIFREMLITLGYKVTTRTSSVEALEAFQNNPYKYDLVITDMTMPNMTGKDLAVEMLSIRPDMPIILATGFSDRIDEERARAIGIKAFVMKPVVFNELAGTIRSVLENNKSAPSNP